jgi:hypothetical protein
MIKRFKRMIALGVTMTFLTLLPFYSLPVQAEQALERDKETAVNAEQTRNVFEKEMQMGYQASPKNILPVIIGIAAVAAAVFLLVMLVSKDKYDITGSWDFHNTFTSGNVANFDSVWTFTAFDDFDKVVGIYVRQETDQSTQGRYTIVNKKEVVFQDDWMTEQYVGQFDSKTTMSGTFVLVSGAQGTWTATKK